MKRITYILECAEKGSDKWQVWGASDSDLRYIRKFRKQCKIHQPFLQFRIIKRTEEVVR